MPVLCPEAWQKTSETENSCIVPVLSGYYTMSCLSDFSWSYYVPVVLLLFLADHCTAQF